MRASVSVALSALVSFAAFAELPVAELERGGTSFDFSALSERRFTRFFDRSKSIVGEEVSVRTDKSWEREFPLPHTNGGIWRVSCRYRLIHTAASPNRATFGVEPGCYLPFFIPANGGDFKPMSVAARVPRGKDRLKVKFTFNAAVDFEFRDLTIVDDSPRTPVELIHVTAGFLDGRFAVSEGQVGALSFYWRKADPAVRLDRVGFEIRAELPPGIDFVGASFAGKDMIKARKKADGGSVVTFGLAPNAPLPPNDILGWQELVLIVRATCSPRPCGLGRVTLRYDKDGRTFECPTRPLDFFVVPEIRVAKPKKYANGISSSNVLDGLPGSAAFDLLSAFSDAGVNWMSYCGDKDVTMMHKAGIRTATLDISQCNNGYQIGQLSRIPDSDKYHAVDPRSGKPLNIPGRIAVCPVTVYEGSEFFRNDTIPYLRKCLKGTDGCWSNWEPWWYARRGCMCDRCCRKFAEFVNVPYEEVRADWPKCVMQGGRWYDVAPRFRSLEHAKVVKTIAGIVREATGGEKSCGFIPGISWLEMSSWWKPRNYPPENRAIDYAGSQEWMNVWAPYAAWEADHPYIPVKRKPLVHYFAAKDVREQVDADYPVGSRPKLLAMPQGHQCRYWITQPEHISMALDCYFFNGFGATLVYFFPRGYDARYWQKFAEATGRAARYEDFVQQGVRCDADVSVTPARDHFAANVRHVTGYLPDCNDKSMLQTVSWRRAGKTIVAVMNFWQKGEAFFNLKVRGLASAYSIVDENGVLRVHDKATRVWSAKELAETGVRLAVPACRTVVFEFREDAAETGATSVLTDRHWEDVFRARQAALRQKAEVDKAEENSTDAIAVDYMPNI